VGDSYNPRSFAKGMSFITKRRKDKEEDSSKRVFTTIFSADNGSALVRSKSDLDGIEAEENWFRSTPKGRAVLDKSNSFGGLPSESESEANHSISNSPVTTRKFGSLKSVLHTEFELNEEGQIASGTLPALVEILTAPEDVELKLDLNFLDHFLLTYRSFTTANQLLLELKQRY